MKIEYCFQRYKSYVLVDHLCMTEGNPVSSLSVAVSFFSSVPFLISTAFARRRHSSRLLTDSSSSAPLPVIKSCHGYCGERVEKCAPVAGHRGSQVDALTKLEADTEKRKQERGRNVRQSRPTLYKTINAICSIQ